MPDLELVDTDSMLIELERRFDHMVFCGCQDTTSDDAVIRSHHKGSRFVCIALTEYVKRKVFRKLDRSRRDAD